MQAIYAWLKDEEARGVPGNFLCNWGLTEKCHREGRVLVYVDGASRLPVAYQWGGLLQPGILQVRHDMRGKGIGRKLVERRIADAYKKDQCLLFIECKPSSSIPFWQAMGFTLLDDGSDWKNYAYRILEKRHPLPADGKSAAVVIRFYPEDWKWDKSVAPYCTATPVAATTADGVVHLSERVFLFDELHTDVHDPVVEIIVDGLQRYGDKARYDDAQRIGVRACTNGFFIDRIFLPSTSLGNDVGSR